MVTLWWASIHLSNVGHKTGVDAGKGYFPSANGVPGILGEVRVEFQDMDSNAIKPKSRRRLLIHAVI
jgi:hypothetical protein